MTATVAPDALLESGSASIRPLAAQAARFISLVHSRQIASQKHGTARRTGSADLPLDDGRVPAWLGRRMSTLGAVIRRLQAIGRKLLEEDVPVILAGDYNVAPTEIDIYQTISWHDDALVQPESRSRSPMVVLKAAITDPARINLWAGEKAPSEAAYAMIERIGSERLIRNLGALKAHEDETEICRPPDHRPAQKLGMVVLGGKNGTTATDGSVERFYLTVQGI